MSENETNVEKFAKEKAIIEVALTTTDAPDEDALREQQYLAEKSVIERALAQPPSRSLREVTAEQAAAQLVKDEQYLAEKSIIERALQTKEKVEPVKADSALDGAIARALNSKIKPTKTTRDKGYIENIIAARKQNGMSVEPSVIRELILKSHSEYLWYIDGLTVDEAKTAIDNCDVALSFILKDKLFKKKPERLALAKYHLSKGYSVASVPLELFNDALVNVAIKNAEKIITVYAHLYGYYPLQEKQIKTMIKKDYKCLIYDETLSQILGYVNTRIKSHTNPVSFVDALGEVKGFNGTLTGLPKYPQYIEDLVDLTGDGGKFVTIDQLHEIFKVSY